MIRNRRPVALAATAAALLTLAVPACRERDTGKTAAGPATITISGSGTTIPILETLAKTWEASHPDVRFNFLPSSHTAGGVEGVRSNFLDLGALSRDLLPAERHPDIEAVNFASDGLAFVIHPSSGARDVSKQTLLDIYRGTVTDWAKVGGRPGKIVVIGRPDHTSAKIVLDELLFGPGFKFTPELVMIERAEDVLTATATTERSIGYTSVGGASSGRTPVTILSVDGFAPTEENVRSGKYPYVRVLGVAVRKNAPTHVRAFVTFLGSEEAKRILRGAGFFPG